MSLQPGSCFLCGGRRFERVFRYTAPPSGEIRFQFSSAGDYTREVFQCGGCGHMSSHHVMEEGALYSGDYVSSTYGDDGIRRQFERITNLDPAMSDNVGRVRRILDFAEGWLIGERARSSAPTVLDVGSGLCVFLHQMKEAGWKGTALDPDERAARHAREVVRVDAVCGDFMTIEGLGQFDAVTFNKVLEHIPNPARMLARTQELLRPGGFVYVEVPDGEVAARDGADREEFFIDHHHVFSMASLALLARRAGFDPQLIERLQEPSTKYTLRAFLAAPAGGTDKS